MVSSQSDFSVFRLVQLISPISQDIADQYHLERLNKFISIIPQNISSEILSFEIPLKGRDRWVDFHFTALLYPQNLQGLKRASICRRAASICENWIRDITLHQKYTRAFLEFDVGSSKKWPPQASVHFLLNENLEVDIQRIERCYLLMTGNQLNKETLDCMKKIPPRTLAFIGFVTRRPLDWIIFSTTYIHPFSIDSLKDYLNQLNGLSPSFDSETFSLLEKISRYVDSVRLLFDHVNAIKSRICVECYIHDRDLARWQTLISLLLAENVIDRDVTQLLSNWSKEIIDEEYYKIDQKILHKAVKYIGYIKLIYIPNQPLTAKMYLNVDSIRIINSSALDPRRQDPTDPYIPEIS